MQQFIKKHERDIIGALNGWDRIRFRGTIRMLAYLEGQLGWLNDRRILFKQFKDFSIGLTELLKQSVLATVLVICEKTGASAQTDGPVGYTMFATTHE